MKPGSPAVRRHQALKKFEAALAEHLRANELSPNGRTYACIGYCYNKGDFPMYTKAIASYMSAISLGFDNAAVHNNLGYNWTELGNSEKNLIETHRKSANDQFAIAIRMDPNLQAPYYNRARGDFYYLMNKDLHYVPKGEMEDIEQAIRIGPATGDVFRLATVIYACAAERDAENRSRWIQLALPHVAAALQAGYEPESFRQPQFRSFQRDPAFQALLQKKYPPAKPTKISRFIDPKDLAD